MSNDPKSGARTALYASLGAGHLLLEKTKEASGKAAAWARRPVPEHLDSASKRVEDLAGRGEKIVKTVSGSSYTRAAVDQTKNARRQVKAAETSVKKAANSAAEAARHATKRTP